MLATFGAVKLGGASPRDNRAVQTTLQHIGSCGMDYIDVGIKEGARLAVDGRGFKMQGYEKGFYLGGSLFDNVTKDMRIYKEGIFGPVLCAHNYKEALALPRSMTTSNGVAIFTRDGDAARDFAARVNIGRVGVHTKTKTKTVASRWPSGVKGGAEFSIPTMK